MGVTDAGEGVQGRGRAGSVASLHRSLRCLFKVLSAPLEVTARHRYPPPSEHVFDRFEHEIRDLERVEGGEGSGGLVYLAGQGQ